MTKQIKRGDIFWVNLDPALGTEMMKTRPCLIISNNTANEYSKRVIIAPITSRAHKIYSFEVEVNTQKINGKVLLDQIRSIDKLRLGKKIDQFDFDFMQLIDEAIKTALSLK